MVSVVKKKRFWLGLLLVFLLAVVIFLPFIFSSAYVTQAVVARINAKLSGNLSVGSWLIDWQQGFLCRDIAYEDPGTGIRITIPRLTSTQGLAEFLLAPGNFGLVSLDTPVIELSESAIAKASKEDEPKATARPGKDPSAWEKYTLQLQVRDGMVRVLSDGSMPEIGMKAVNLHSNLKEGEINYDLSFRVLDSQGGFDVKGRINLPAGGKNTLETLFTETEVVITDFQVRDYLTFAARHAGTPTGEGVLSADFRLKSVGFDDFVVGGSAVVLDLKLSGGFLGQDTPLLQQVSISLEESEWSSIAWSLKHLDIKSDAGTISCSGEHRGERLRIGSRGNVSIPVLFDRLPHLLRVHEAALIESGELEFTADISMDGPGGKLDFMAKADDLGGLFKGRPFAWESPITAILHSENEGLDFTVKRLQVESPFLQAFGQGDVSSFKLNATADLGRTLVELGKLFQHPWSGTGELEMKMEAAAAETPDRYAFSTDLNISGLALSRSEKVVVPNHHFSIVGSGEVPLSMLREQKGGFNLQFALSSWIGEVFFTMNGERIADGLVGTRYSTDTNIQLDSFSNLLDSLDFFPGGIKLGGDLQVQAAGFIDHAALGVDELNGRIHDFVLTRNNTRYADKDIRLRIDRFVNDDIPTLAIHDLVLAKSRDTFFRTGVGSNSIDFGRAGIFLHNIDVEAELGTIHLKEFVVRSWHEPQGTLNADVDIATDLARLTPLLQNIDILPSGMNLAGAGRLAFSAEEDEGGSRKIAADLRVEDFLVVSGDKKLLPGDALLLKARIEGAAGAESLAIREVHLSSTALDLTGSGSVAGDENVRQLAIQGELRPKLDALASILESAFDVPVAMQGRNSRPFALQYRWPGEGKSLDRLGFSSALSADKFVYKGINLNGVDMPVTLKDKTLQVHLQGAMNEGRLDVAARTDFNLVPAVVSVPADSLIMKDVQLNQPLVEGLLQGIHPLFGVLASPTGQVDVRLDTFTWPLEPLGANAAEFSSVVNVSRVNLDSSGLLKSILTSFALEEEKLKLRDAEVQCSGREGRVSCSPVRILAGGTEMVLSGSVGMDRTIDYVLEVPITEKLVSPEVYQFLDGTRVRVPITGTVDRPGFDRNSVTASIREMVKQAAIKVVEKQAEKLLPDLMDSLLGSPQKKQN